MHGLKNQHKQSIILTLNDGNLTLNDGDEVGDGVEGARDGRPLTKALGGRAHHLLQPVDVSLRCGG